jgi:hypothetical protein
MLRTVAGIATRVKDEQPLKAYSPTVVAPDGILISVKRAEFSNERARMVITLEGKLTRTKPEHP